MAIRELDLFADNNNEEAAPEVQESAPSVAVQAVEQSEDPEDMVEQKASESPAEQKSSEGQVEQKASEGPVEQKATEMPVVTEALEDSEILDNNDAPATPELAEPLEQDVPMSSPEVAGPLPEPSCAATPQGSVGALFRTFFKIGIVTFGGGYAMIPLIESEVVDKKQWVEKEQFLDLIAVAQTCPGVFAVNISTFIGYKLRRTPGALLAALGAALPSFLIILSIAMLFRQFQDVAWVEACFKGIRPAVVALIAVPTFNLAKSAKIGWSTCWIPIVGALLIWLFGVNPIWVIVGAALLGYLYGTLLNN